VRTVGNSPAQEGLDGTLTDQITYYQQQIIKTQQQIQEMEVKLATLREADKTNALSGTLTPLTKLIAWTFRMLRVDMIRQSFCACCKKFC
jgi:hypothetical protein